MNPPEATQADRSDEKETGRVEAFSDGVFGIAMTLLVLELKVPSLHAAGGAITPRSLGAALLAQWPSYFAFASSFFTILTMWVHHHALFKLVRRADAGLLFANGLLLFLVTAVPFPTAILAEYLRTPAAKMAAGFYSGVFVFIAVAYSLLLRAALCPGLLSPTAPPAVVRRFRRSYRLGPVFYLLATAAAFSSALLSMLVCTGLWIFWVVVTIDGHRHE